MDDDARESNSAILFSIRLALKPFYFFHSFFFLWSSWANENEQMNVTLVIDYASRQSEQVNVLP